MSDAPLRDRLAGSVTLLAYTRVATVVAPFVLSAALWWINDTLTDIRKGRDEQNRKQDQLTQLIGSLRNELTADIGTLRVQLTAINGTASQLGSRIDDTSRTFNSRLDAQSEWIRQQTKDIDDLKKRVYPLSPAGGVPK